MTGFNLVVLAHVADRLQDCVDFVVLLICFIRMKHVANWATCQHHLVSEFDVATQILHDEVSSDEVSEKTLHEARESQWR
jgi:hypothetical protein